MGVPVQTPFKLYSGDTPNAALTLLPYGIRELSLDVMLHDPEALALDDNHLDTNTVARILPLVWPQARRMRCLRVEFSDVRATHVSRSAAMSCFDR